MTILEQGTNVPNREVEAPGAPATPEPSKEEQLRKTILAHQRPSRWRSSLQLANSILPYLALWVLAYWSLSVSYWLTLPICALAGAFLVRVFIIAHDCGHGSFFHSKRANAFWGSIASTLSFMPYYAWKYDHSVHHANSGNLDKRGLGDIDTLTVREYLAAPRWKRLRYRLYRHPIVMLLLGPVYVFMVSYRFWAPGSSRRSKMSVIRTNIALLALFIGASMLIGWKAFLAIQVPIIAISGSAGIWLFYVQHQFEGVYWERQENWSFVQQAMHGSSYYQLPRILQWFSGNIGFHHVHHLGAKIPNYLLEKCHKEVSRFWEIKPITLRSSLKCLHFRLWDEDRRQLVGFPK